MSACARVSLFVCESVSLFVCESVGLQEENDQICPSAQEELKTFFLFSHFKLLQIFFLAEMNKGDLRWWFLLKF